MSFGFSVGDFLATARLIKGIVSSLRNASASSYQELARELHSLQRALHDIEHLPCPAGQEAAVNNVKVAALTCQYPLEEFAAKLKKFEVLGELSNPAQRNRHKLSGWAKKVIWGLKMDEEAAKLRAYISIHVGCLNMRLVALGLKSLSVAATETEDQYCQLQSQAVQMQTCLASIQKEVSQFRSATEANSTTIDRLHDLISSEVGAQLRALIDRTTTPDTRYTWFQDPVQFEDVLVRVFPIPSEYNWDAKFSTGPASNKVKAGKYQLFNVNSQIQPLAQSQAKTFQLFPGMKIRMALILGRYDSEILTLCPRVGCKSMNTTPNTSGGRLCNTCGAWYSVAARSVPRPFRQSDADMLGFSATQMPYGTAGPKPSIEAYQQRREEQMRFKNIVLFFSELPHSPQVPNVRIPRDGPKRRRTGWDHNWLRGNTTLRRSGNKTLVSLSPATSQKHDSRQEQSRSFEDHVTHAQEHNRLPMIPPRKNEITQLFSDLEDFLEDIKSRSKERLFNPSIEILALPSAPSLGSATANSEPHQYMGPRAQSVITFHSSPSYISREIEVVREPDNAISENTTDDTISERTFDMSNIPPPNHMPEIQEECIRSAWGAMDNWPFIK